MVYTVAISLAGIRALLDGCYYSSSGPEIDGFGVQDDSVYLDRSACERVNFIAGGYSNAGITVIAPTQDGVKHAEYKLRGDETYVRAECTDYAGKTAWTNAIMLKRI